MDRPRLIRVLRIAWSAWWGLLCVLSIGLWVRSYWRSDTISFPIASTRSLSLGAVHGVFYSEYIHWNDEAPAPQFEFESERISAETPEFLAARPSFEWDMSQGGDGDSLSVSLPYWLPVVLSAATALVPVVVRRFSLRTLFVAMTLIAAGLGMVVLLAAN